MITDTQRIEWLCKRVSYIEHSDRNGVLSVKQIMGGYWPQLSAENPCENVIEELADMPLIDYIDAMIALERK